MSGSGRQRPTRRRRNAGNILTHAKPSNALAYQGVRQQYFEPIQNTRRKAQSKKLGTADPGEGSRTQLLLSYKGAVPARGGAKIRR